MSMNYEYEYYMKILKKAKVKKGGASSKTRNHCQELKKTMVGDVQRLQDEE